MDEIQGQSAPGDAFVFTGTWRDYLPIAASNFFLTIVTLGIYRSWAKARERRYLWSHTIFIDDRLEWTGTGKEMFIGFLVATLVAGVPLFLLNMFAQSLALHGQPAQSGFVTLLLYLAAMGLFGFARFRALRYRLSRTWWHGIRGGSEIKGGHYAWSALWKPACGAFAMSFLIPWSMTSLWNERWNAMSFGSHRFDAAANTEGLMWRWALVVLPPTVLLFVMIGALSMRAPAVMFAAILLVYLCYFVGGLIYYAGYYAKAVGSLELGEVGFLFEASTFDWFKLLLGDIGLVIGTLGFGIMFLGYRHWSFFIRHLGATGIIDVESIVQSSTIAPREAEGFADAFDIGAL